MPDTFFESFTPSIIESSGIIAPATTTGPAKGPLPASSIPHIYLNPFLWHSVLLLFVAGAISALPDMPLEVNILALVLFLSAVLGDSCNYMIGHFFGNKLFNNPDSRIFKQSHLEKTHEFYKKYGGKTIILARFVPIVRTFAPFVAGMGKMHYYYFMVYNLIGGALWVGIFCYAGYFFGDLPFVQKNLKLLIVAIIVVSILPAVIEVGRNKWKTRHY